MPAFAGLGARTGIRTRAARSSGCRAARTRAHIARAALEAIAFQSADLLRRCSTTRASRCSELRVDGGAAANDFLMQFQADLLGVAVVRPQTTETTALGAAYLAGLAVGFWKSLDDIARTWHARAAFRAAHELAPRPPADSNAGR